MSYPPVPQPAVNQQKSFFSMLFDISFSEFITLKVIRVIYIIGLVLVGLFAIFGIISSIIGASRSPVSLLGIIVVPLIALVYIILLRLGLELTAVIFRIGQNTTIMANSIDPGAAQLDLGMPQDPQGPNQPPFNPSDPYGQGQPGAPLQ